MSTKEQQLLTQVATEKGSAWNIPFGIQSTGKATGEPSMQKSNRWCWCFTFQCPGKISVSRVQLWQQGEVSEKDVLHEGRASTGQGWDPTEL